MYTAWLISEARKWLEVAQEKNCALWQRAHQPGGKAIIVHMLLDAEKTAITASLKLFDKSVVFVFSYAVLQLQYERGNKNLLLHIDIPNKLSVCKSWMRGVVN